MPSTAALSQTNENNPLIEGDENRLASEFPSGVDKANRTEKHKVTRQQQGQWQLKSSELKKGSIMTRFKG